MDQAVAKRTATAADRAYARYNLMTPAQVAARLQDGDAAGKDRITADTVRSWIEDPRPEYRLRALDLRSPGADRPRWFLEWEWVEEFLARRSNLPLDHAS